MIRCEIPRDQEISEARFIEGVAGLGLTDLPRGADIGIDGRAFAFTFGLALATGLIYGLLRTGRTSCTCR